MGSMNKGDDDSGFGISEEEKRKLLEEAEEEILKIQEVQINNETDNL